MRTHFILWHGVNEWEEFNGTLEDAIKHIKSDARYKNYGHQGAMVIASSIHYEIAVDGTEYHKEAAEKKIAEQEPLVLFTKRLYARLCDGSLSLAEWADDDEIDEIAHYKEGYEKATAAMEAAESENEVLRKTCNDRNHKGLDILIARHGLGQSLENTDDYGQDVALLAMLLSNRDDSSAP